MDEALVGMRVRSSKGALGQIASASADGIEVHWMTESILMPQKERLRASDKASFKDLELLTLMDGWQPLAEVTSAFTSAKTPTLLEDLESLLAEASPKNTPANPNRERSSGASREKKARAKRKERKGGGGGHNPFKTKSHLGPGPRHSTNDETKAWKCSCATPYKCLCRSGKKKKTIRIKKDYKKGYNRDYKQWVKHQPRARG